jgi:hypothetical protein
MNDAADKPQDTTSEEPAYRMFSDEELQRILENHKQWLESRARSS